MIATEETDLRERCENFDIPTMTSCLRGMYGDVRYTACEKFLAAMIVSLVKIVQGHLTPTTTPPTENPGELPGAGPDGPSIPGHSTGEMRDGDDGGTVASGPAPEQRTSLKELWATNSTSIPSDMDGAAKPKHSPLLEKPAPTPGTSAVEELIAAGEMLREYTDPQSSPLDDLLAFDKKWGDGRCNRKACEVRWADAIARVREGMGKPVHSF